jgi:TetR/AcrR family transcriptional regulator
MTNRDMSPDSVPLRPTGKGTRREEILFVATKLFSDRGYDGASMETLAKNVGLRKASLFHHFPSKDALYAEVLGSLLADIGSMLDTAIVTHASYLERLAGFADSIVDAFGKRPHAGKLLFREAMDKGPVMEKWLGKAIADLLARGLAIAEEGKRRGHFVGMDTKNIIVSMVGIYIVPFAINNVIEEFEGTHGSAAEQLERRKKAVRAQLLALAGPGSVPSGGAP